jgi:uncharacterized protein YecE (DUF72 family)
MPDQLGLFELEPEKPSRKARGGDWPTPGSPLEVRYERYRVLAATLPPTLRMGTSSWSFPGWHGIVYSRRRAASMLGREGLREYARHPLLRTVGIDRGYYAPIPEEDLRRYAADLPDGFVCCTKAPAGVTSAREPGPRRQAGPNPDYLSVPRFVSEMLEPFSRAFAPHAGPFILQFSAPAQGQPADATAFTESLDRFLDQLPRQFTYGVELRDRFLLTDPYRRVLMRHGATHVYNYWSAMPMPGDQTRTIAPEDLPFVVVRLLLRPGTWYEEQRHVFAPFDALVEPDDNMRRDTMAIIRRAAKAGRQVFLLVNNKSEGSAPLTIEALAERYVADTA